MVNNKSNVEISKQENGLYAVKIVDLPGVDLKDLGSAINKYRHFLGKAKNLAAQIAQAIEHSVK